MTRTVYPSTVKDNPTNGQASSSHPKGSGAESAHETFPGDEQATKTVQTVLSPEAALIAEKIPRIEPMLRMIESNGFIVVGLNEEPDIEDPIFEEPIQLKGYSPGISELSNLLQKRGHHVVRCLEPLDARKAVQE